jgi:hypothetical protein
MIPKKREEEKAEKKKKKKKKSCCVVKRSRWMIPSDDPEISAKRANKQRCTQGDFTHKFVPQHDSPKFRGSMIQAVVRSPRS